MNFKRLKRYFLKKQVEASVKKPLPREAFRECKTVGVLVDKEDFPKMEVFVSLVERLQILHKDLKVVAYKEDRKGLPTLDQDVFSSKDFSWNGVLQKPAVEEFLGRTYDVFIAYYARENSYMDAITTKVNARLKVGMEGADRRLFDLLFKIPLSDYALFEKELEKYVLIFKKNH